MKHGDATHLRIITEITFLSNCFYLVIYTAAHDIVGLIKAGSMLWWWKLQPNLTDSHKGVRKTIASKKIMQIMQKKKKEEVSKNQKLLNHKMGMLNIFLQLPFNKKAPATPKFYWRSQNNCNQTEKKPLAVLLGRDLLCFVFFLVYSKRQISRLLRKGAFCHQRPLHKICVLPVLAVRDRRDKPSDWHLHEPMVSTFQAEIFTFMHSVTILMFLCHELQQAVLTQSNYIAHKPRNKGQRGCKAVK